MLTGGGIVIPSAFLWHLLVLPAWVVVTGISIPHPSRQKDGGDSSGYEGLHMERWRRRSIFLGVTFRISPPPPPKLLLLFCFVVLGG